MLRKKQVRIPTLLAFLLLFLSLVGGIYLVENFPPFLGKAASEGIIPQDVRLSKISDSSFVVSWLTLEKTPGLVRFGAEGKLEKVAYDIRDRGVPQKYRVHYVEITGLSSQEVNFEIVSGGKSFPQKKITLGRQIIEPAQALPIYGELKTQEGGQTQGAIIYLSLEGAALWSSFLSQRSTWVIPLGTIRTKDLANSYCRLRDCGEKTKVKIEIYAEEGNSGVVTLLGKARPFPETIILGRNYSSLSLETTEESPQVFGEKTRGKNWEVKILTPKEGVALSFEKPLIRGLGIPGKEVIITLESKKTQKGKVKVREDGTWFWTPYESLSPGEHRLIVKTEDAQGNRLTIKRTFLVLKSGLKVLAGATPSATLTPTKTPTPWPTVFPTATPTPPRITPSPTLPPSGFLLPSFLLLSAGLSLLFLGLTIF